MKPLQYILASNTGNVSEFSDMLMIVQPSVLGEALCLLSLSRLNVLFL